MGDRSEEELLEAAKWGRLSGSELRGVAQKLSESAGDWDAYVPVQILGRAGASQYEPLVADILRKTQNGMVARICLQTLCVYWDKATSYVDLVVEFASRRTSEEDAPPRLIALSVLGMLARMETRLDWIGLLLSTYETSESGSADRSAAYDALATAFGLTTVEQVRMGKEDPRILEWARSITGR